MSDKFLPNYIKTITGCIGNNFTDNYDIRRFGPLKKMSLNLRQRIAYLASPFSNVSHIDDFEWLYQHLADEESKQILLQVLAFRALGHRRVKLPLNNPQYWSTIEKLERLAVGTESIELGFKSWKAYKMDLSSIGYPIQLYVPPTVPIYAFILEQYRCQTPTEVIEVTEGDIVMDAGGCWGDTALYFAYKTGVAGKVYSFEFMPDNIKIFGWNMGLNVDFSDRIHLVEQALWSTTGEKLFIEGEGPATCVVSKPSNPLAKQIETLTIDDLVYREGLPRVDFIKMDIEGAELQALKGAEQTIRQFSPKLAISVYHNLHDFWKIPQWIDQLRLNYRFSLRHFTIHQEETVLFATLSS